MEQTRRIAGLASAFSRNLLQRDSIIGYYGTATVAPVFVDKNTRVICQGIASKNGTFHTEQAIAYGTKVESGTQKPVVSFIAGLTAPSGCRMGHAGAMKCRLPVSLRMTLRAFSSDISLLPPIADPDVRNAFKDILASDWDEIHDPVKANVMGALSKKTDDKAGQEALANAWRAAEAVEDFSGILESLRMELDEINGPTGENVRPLPDELQGALRAAYKRYSNYLDAFGTDETYLRKKVENELGTRMIHLKMRCAGLDSEWEKVTLLGTSGISGSYIELRS